MEIHQRSNFENVSRDSCIAFRIVINLVTTRGSQTRFNVRHIQRGSLTRLNIRHIQRVLFFWDNCHLLSWIDFIVVLIIGRWRILAQFEFWISRGIKMSGRHGVRNVYISKSSIQMIKDNEEKANVSCTKSCDY